MSDGDPFFVVGLIVVAGGAGLANHLWPDPSVSPELMLILVISPYVTLAAMIVTAWFIIPEKASGVERDPA